MIRIICIFALWIGWSSYQLTRGKSVAPSTFEMTDFIKSTDKMRKRLSLSEFIARSKDVHGNKYGYSLINEKNFTELSNKVPIICPTHGIFYQKAKGHLYGSGCPLCGRLTQGCGVHTKSRKLVFGIGVNDSLNPISVHGHGNTSYRLWKQMLCRCYGECSRGTSYEDCKVCDEWHYFSNFEMWFNEHKNEYHNGYHLDKDILVKGNKVYSPNTCCFVPPQINTLITKHDKTRGEYPIGVSYNKWNGKNFRAILRQRGKYVMLGFFDTPQEAFNAYKNAKEAHIKDMARKYYQDGKISEKTYNALMNYNVEITD